MCRRRWRHIRGSLLPSRTEGRTGSPAVEKEIWEKEEGIACEVATEERKIELGGRRDDEKFEEKFLTRRTGSRTQIPMNLLGKSKRRNGHFVENGGNLLKDLISSTHGKINPIRIFTLEELRKATDNFSRKMIVNKGYLSVIYRGNHNGQLLAVKAYHRHIFFPEMFINEMVSLSQANHRNIQKLIGCCVETAYPMLVIELMPNGSLYNKLKKADTSSQLQWADRMRIAIEVADALTYLHTALRLPITHGNVSSHSILLDECFTVKLCTFVFSEMQKDPICHDQNINVDIRDFGMLLTKLVTGKVLLHCSSNTWEDVLSISAENIKEEDASQARACYELAMRCVDDEEKPRMKQVVQELRKISKSDAICGS